MALYYKSTNLSTVFSLKFKVTSFFSGTFLGAGVQELAVQGQSL